MSSFFAVRSACFNLIRTTIPSCGDAPGSGSTAGFDKLVHILGLRKAGAFASHHIDTMTFRCPRAGCGRRYDNAADLKLHEHTHKDVHLVSPLLEDIAAEFEKEHKLHASHVTRFDTPLVLIGPYAHHSNILPWYAAC
jgi:hypothetical protein